MKVFGCFIKSFWFIKTECRLKLVLQIIKETYQCNIPLLNILQNLSLNKKIFFKYHYIFLLYYNTICLFNFSSIFLEPYSPWCVKFKVGLNFQSFSRFKPYFKFNMRIGKRSLKYKIVSLYFRIC